MSPWMPSMSRKSCRRRVTYQRLLKSCLRTSKTSGGTWWGGDPICRTSWSMWKKQRQWPPTLSLGITVRSPRKIPHLWGLHNYATSTSLFCPVCEREGHEVLSCERFATLQPEDCLQTAIRLKLCFVCLRGGHITSPPRQGVRQKTVGACAPPCYMLLIGPSYGSKGAGGENKQLAAIAVRHQLRSPWPPVAYTMPKGKRIAQEMRLPAEEWG